jgi:hypothetical protein
MSEVRHCEPLAESYIDIIDVIPQEADVSSQAGRPGANALRRVTTRPAPSDENSPYG